MAWRDALIARMLGDMRGNGPKRAQISFLIGNAAAEKCYRASGFEFAEDKTAKDFEAAMGVPGIRRLARDIMSDEHGRCCAMRRGALAEAEAGDAAIDERTEELIRHRVWHPSGRASISRR